MKPCLNVGHNGAAGVNSEKQMQNLKDVTDHVKEFFSANDDTFTLVRNVSDSMIPGGLSSFKFARAGEGIFYSNGLPVLFVTRLSSENGCDANIGKWYRKQWYYENYLRKLNPDCTHLTFIHASEPVEVYFKVTISRSLPLSVFPVTKTSFLVLTDKPIATSSNSPELSNDFNQS